VGIGPVELILVVSLVAAVILWWKIFQKAGWPAPLAILLIMPLVNLMVMIIFALSEWPIERELRRFRELEADRQASRAGERAG